MAERLMRTGGDVYDDVLQLSMENLADVFQDLDRLADAARVLDRSLSMLRRRWGDADHLAVAACMTSLADVLRLQGKLSAARPLLTGALEMRRRLVAQCGGDHSFVIASLYALARLYLEPECGLLIEAEALLSEAMALVKSAAAASGGDVVVVGVELLALIDESLADARRQLKEPAARAAAEQRSVQQRQAAQLPGQPVSVTVL
jgi:hypothetical protein